MRINTRQPGSLDLTKTEQVLLAKAKLLLLAIAKHGEGTTADAADGAADNIGALERLLGVNQVGVK